MTKTSLRKIIDLALWLLFCFMLGTGLLIHYRLVPGSQGGHGLVLMGISRHEWGEYHLWAAYLFLGLLAAHLYLNYTFIRNVIAQKRTWRALGLVGVGAAVVAFFLVLPIDRQDDGQNSRKGPESAAIYKEADGAVRVSLPEASTVGAHSSQNEDHAKSLN